jgi:hypothetical protein
LADQGLAGIPGVAPHATGRDDAAAAAPTGMASLSAAN